MNLTYPHFFITFHYFLDSGKRQLLLLELVHNLFCWHASICLYFFYFFFHFGKFIVNSETTFYVVFILGLIHDLVEIRRLGRWMHKLVVRRRHGHVLVLMMRDLHVVIIVISWWWTSILRMSLIRWDRGYLLHVLARWGHFAICALILRCRPHQGASWLHLVWLVVNGRPIVILVILKLGLSLFLIGILWN